MWISKGIVAVAVLLGLASPAAAITISVDEYGTGLTSTGLALAINSGPYTVANPLTYTLPFNVTTGGFLQLCEEISNNCSSGLTGESDLIGFTASSNTLKFWSDNFLTYDSSGNLVHEPSEPGVLADTGFPDNVNNPLQRTELVGAGTLRYYDYTPTTGQPGFVTGQSNTYHLVSDGQLTPVSGVPEPSSLLLLGSGLAGLAAWRYRMRQNSAA